VLTRDMDEQSNRQTGVRTDGQLDSYIPPKLCLRRYKRHKFHITSVANAYK